MARTCEGQSKFGLRSSSHKQTDPLKFQDWEQLKAFSETSSSRAATDTRTCTQANILSFTYFPRCYTQDI